MNVIEVNRNTPAGMGSAYRTRQLRLEHVVPYDAMVHEKEQNRMSITVMLNALEHRQFSTADTGALQPLSPGV